jgi:N6-adenosine-specific RNA methylase IME4/ParB-like chromosome segregation protein Spo0J
MEEYQLFDELTAEEYQALKEDIRQRGVLVPIELDENGAVLDGHHRKRAWEELRAEGVQLPDYPRIIRKFANEAEKRNHVRALNILRRHLTKDQQRAQWVAMRQDGMTYQAIADTSGVSKPTVINAVKSESKNLPSLPETITTTNGRERPASYDRRPAAPQVSIFATTERQQKEALVVAPNAHGDMMTTKNAQKQVSEMRRYELATAARDAPKLTGKYRVIYADPPWSYGNTMPEYAPQPDDHYGLMDIEDIRALPVKDLAENDAVLFMWTTSPHLEESFSVVKAWGFAYKSSFVWDKVRHNMGHYNSVRHEFLLVCVRGSCQPDVKQLFDSVVTEERTEHSRKPETFRGIIDTIYPNGKRIELFARRPADGWEVWGNERIS